MEFLKILFNFISSKKITLTIINILGILLIGVLFMANSPIWTGILSAIWMVTKPFFIGFIIAFALNPFISWVERYTNNRTISIAIIYLGGIAIIGLLLWLVVPMIYNSVSQMTPALTSGLTEIQTFIMDHFSYDISSLVKYLQTSLNDILADTTVLDTTLDVINQAISTITNVLIYLVLALYMSANYINIRSLFKRIAFRIDKHLPSYLVQIDYSLVQYIKAFMIGAIAQGVMTSAIYIIIGQPNWLVLGLLSAVSSIFPYVGPIAINIVGVVVCLSMGTTTVIILFILIFIQSIVMSYVITPKIYSTQIDLSVMWVLFGILSGSTLFGVWGMVIAMPILVSIKIVYRIYREHNLYNVSFTTEPPNTE